MLRKLNVLVFAVLIIFVVSGCGGGSDSTSTGQNTNNTTASYVMQLGHTLSETSVRHEVLVEFKNRIETATDGDLEIQVHGNNSLGDNNQLMQAVPLGTIQAAVQPTAFFGGVSDEVGVVDLPFIWNDMKHIEEVVTTDLVDNILAPLEKVGMKGLALWPVGIQVLTSNEPIDTPENLRGQQFRTMGTQVQLDLFSNWGTHPTAIAIPELYSSLQQGVVLGQSNDVGTIHDLNLFEVQDYMLLTNHAGTLDVFYVNNEWFQSLPEDYQNLMIETARELTTMKTDKDLAVMDDKFNTIKESQQMEIIEPSDEMLAWLREGADLVVEEFLTKYPDMAEVVDQIRNSQ
ncbi:hypothetical protein BTR23_24975 [Alkalihalophilus pseudofirmus]|nr:hypothetical protein BTR23_24975 [Alkalihalophilus pseudofirmus]